MPIDYTIDAATGRVMLRYTGTVTDQELFTVFGHLYADPRHRVGMPELSDCRAVERIEVTAAGLQALAQITADRLDWAGQTWKVAIVAPADLVYGLGRMYEMLREGSPEQVMVFRDFEEAERWLAG